MNIKLFLSAIAALAIASCDDSAMLGTPTRQAGTSSETQSELQALADSVSQIVVGFKNASAFAARSGQQTQGSSQNHKIATYSYETGIRLVLPRGLSRELSISGAPGTDYLHRSETFESFGPDKDSLRGNLYTTMLVTPYMMSFRSMLSWEIAQPPTLNIWTGETTRPSALKTDSGFGRTRAGFRYSWKLLGALDSQRLELETYRRFLDDCWEFQPTRIFSLGNEWEIVAPGLSPRVGVTDTLLVFHSGRHAGWLVNDSIGGWTRPLHELGLYHLFDLAGNRIDPVSLPPVQPWYGDSLGVFWQTPKWDSVNREFSIPVRWKLLPGTAQTISNGGIADSVFAATSTGRFLARMRLDADSGSGTMILPEQASGSQIDALFFPVPLPNQIYLRGYTVSIPSIVE